MTAAHACSHRGRCAHPGAELTRCGNPAHSQLPAPQYIKALSSHRTRNSEASLEAQKVKNPPAMQKTWVQFLGQEDPLEDSMATHFSILARRIPWTEEPGRLHRGHSMITQDRQHSRIWGPEPKSSPLMGGHPGLLGGHK